ncbi:MAG: hypothetical protein M3Y80_07625, partial [Verrucomicrobiota bacterium]|nr:hypothetical protein [Verrucomicrobiota bacterium]
MAAADPRALGGVRGSGRALLHLFVTRGNLFERPTRAAFSMSQSDRNSKKENKSGGNEPSFNWRGVVL